MGAWAELHEELLAGEAKGKTRPERPQGLCGPLSFVTQRDDLAYVGIDRSRMGLSVTTSVDTQWCVT